MNISSNHNENETNSVKVDPFAFTFVKGYLKDAIKSSRGAALTLNQIHLKKMEHDSIFQLIDLGDRLLNMGLERMTEIAENKKKISPVVLPIRPSHLKELFMIKVMDDDFHMKKAIWINLDNTVKGYEHSLDNKPIVEKVDYSREPKIIEELLF